MNKKVLIILCVVFALVLLGAGVLYTNLSDRVEIGGLATEPVEETNPSEGDPEAFPAPDAINRLDTLYRQMLASFMPV